MFKKLLALLGKKAPPPAAAPQGEPPSGPIAPYAREDLNLVYNLLFCDDASLFKSGDDVTRALFSEEAEPKIVRAIADDADEESRVRVLAYNWLHDKLQPVPPKETLGVVVEVALEEGLDVLAAYADGTARYINHTGKVSVYESHPPEIAAQARELVKAAKGMVKTPVAGIRQRHLPPAGGQVRATALASDGLYVNQGPFAAMASAPHTVPVMQAAQKLLDLIVAQGRGDGRP
ncbi:hypothetical protein [Pseudoduganella namucuonensis]|nr:hypothetical protein [Pseudoduganella namucuonensis]